MPLGSAGMYVPIPDRWGAKYVDGGVATSFSDWFHVELAFWYLVLELEVLTSYEDITKSAVVRVNAPQQEPIKRGSSIIGRIEPRPLSRYQELQRISFYFTAGRLHPKNPATGTVSGPQLFEIEPVSAFDWLVVGKWHIIYHQRTH
jgi:hypothetical protein